MCDLDLLAAGDRIEPDVETVKRWIDLEPEQARTVTPENLILPHPRLHERSFVLVPLAEIAPDWVHPILNRSATELCADLRSEDRAAIVPINS